jgi:hypothetical protein
VEEQASLCSFPVSARSYVQRASHDGYSNEHLSNQRTSVDVRVSLLVDIRVQDTHLLFLSSFPLHHPNLLSSFRNIILSSISIFNMRFTALALATFAVMAMAAPADASGSLDVLAALENRAAHCPCYASGTCGCQNGKTCFCVAGTGTAPCAHSNTCGCFNGLAGKCK